MNPSARLVLLLLALSAGAHAAETATLSRDTELRAKPAGDAPVVATLAAKAVVSLQSRTGAWAQVATGDGKSGYVRLLNLRTGSGQKGEAGAGALASVFRTGSSGNSVATGVKGLSEEQLTGAEPAPAEVEKLAGYAATDKQARDGAKAAGLAAKEVAWLPAPAAEEKKRKKKRKNEE